MNANKILSNSVMAVALTALLSPAAALAAGSAPALYGVQEIQVQHGRMGNAKASANCGTSSGEVAAMVLRAFKADGLPAFSVLEAPEKKADIARVDVYPDVVTVQPREKECISWISLTVQSKELLQISPVSTPRTLTTTYWSGGLMTGSSITSHPNTINDAILKLAAQFSRQYRLDQPPDLTPPEVPAKVQ